MIKFSLRNLNNIYPEPPNIRIMSCRGFAKGKSKSAVKVIISGISVYIKTIFIPSALLHQDFNSSVALKSQNIPVSYG